MDVDRPAYLARVAAWYYEDGLGQRDIAQRIGRSRSMVSRLLQEARDMGLVEIRVHHPLKTDSTLAQRIQDVFGVEARILADSPVAYPEMLKRLGQLGADCLQEHLHDGIRVGIGWGTAVHAVVEAIPYVPLRDAIIVQIIGATGYGDPTIDGPELARWLAQKLGASYRFLNAPLIMENQTIVRSLQQEPAIANTLALVSQLDIGVVGIGTPDPAFSSLRRAGYLDHADLHELTEQGAVGDILARQLDANGNQLSVPLNQRVVGMDLETLRSLPTVMAVAGGITKAPAILAALHGGYVDVLITDAGAAERMLALYGAYSDAA